jgi:hypothetical protein
LFETGLAMAGEEDSSARGAGTLSPLRMLVAAAPARSRQLSAMMVMTLVKQFSVSVAGRSQFPENWGLIKA